MNLIQEIRQAVQEYDLDWDMSLKDFNTKIVQSTFVCPKCKGKGEIYIEDCFGDSRTGNYFIKCDLCNGQGRTKEKYKEITQIVGYEKEIK